MADHLQKLGNSHIQHGPSSDRVYALELAPTDMPEILDEIEDLAQKHDYGKLVAKARESDFGAFMARGYKVEARIPEFFGEDEPGLFVGKYLDPERATEKEPEKVAEVLMTAQLERTLNGLKGEPEPVNTDAGPALEIREALPEDAEAIAECYQSVFESYPFPIHDPSHIREAQEEGTRFFTVWEGQDLVAASSMEPGGATGTVEMTDFATLPSHRGRGLATKLLGIMDRHAKESGLRVAYTIARAVSFGMNITFARRSYQYAGTLINNTQIAGSIESMNIWYKAL
ncbi:MAG: putative beta-lysine N-acetyltransferase [Gemmatimonadota bacterium]